MNAKELLSELVSFPVLGGQSNLTIAHHIKTHIESFGVAVHSVPNEDRTKTSLHCRIGPEVDGGVILSGHMDVVPVEGQQWDTDPFRLTERDGKLYGRGSSDMKGFLACCLAGLPEMTRHPLRKPIYFAFSYDEEIGCLSAPALAQHIKATYTEKPRHAIIGEPSLLKPVVGQKGIYVMSVRVNGSAGHSSRIHQEVSAVHEAARLILWLESKMQALVSNGHIDDRFHPPHTSIHIGKIQGGVAHNIIADDASFCCDIRTIPRDRLEDIIQAFEAHCKEREHALRKVFPDFKIEITEDHPPVPALDTPEHRSVVSLIREITGVQALEAVSYAAEAGQFAEAGFESVICGPGCISRAHRANEYISTEELEGGVRMIQRLIETLR